MQDGSYEYEEMSLYFVESLVTYVSTLQLKACAHTIILISKFHYTTCGWVSRALTISQSRPLVIVWSDLNRTGLINNNNNNKCPCSLFYPCIQSTHSKMYGLYALSIIMCFDRIDPHTPRAHNHKSNTNWIMSLLYITIALFLNASNCWTHKTNLACSAIFWLFSCK
jgi:hypothetical protein